MDIEIIESIADLLVFFSVIVILICYIAACQFSHESVITRIFINITGLAIFYSIYLMFIVKDDDPFAIEVEIAKKLLITSIVMGSSGFFILYYLKSH